MRDNTKSILRRSDTTTSIDISSQICNLSPGITGINYSKFSRPMLDGMWETVRCWWVLCQSQLLSPSMLPSFLLSYNLFRWTTSVPFKRFDNVLTMRSIKVGRRLQSLVRRLLDRKRAAVETVGSADSPHATQVMPPSKHCVSSCQNGDKHQPHRLAKIVEVTEILEDAESNERDPSTDQ